MPILPNCFDDEGEAYIVPLSFGYELIEDKYIFYFHGAKEGRKAPLIRKSPTVGFELDTNYALNESAIACGFSTSFQSIIGTGIISEVVDNDEKLKGLSIIMKHYTDKYNWEYNKKLFDEVMIFKLRVLKMDCKEHK